MNNELNFPLNFERLVLGCTSYGARPQTRAVNLSLTNFQRTAPWVRWRIRQAAGRTRGCPHGMADGQKPGGRSDESTDEIQECMKIRKFENSNFHIFMKIS